MSKGLDWVHHDSKTFDEEQFMENIERKYIEKHTSHIKGFIKDYVDKLLEEKDKEIERLNNTIKDIRDYVNFLVIINQTINGKFSETQWGQDILGLIGDDSDTNGR